MTLRLSGSLLGLGSIVELANEDRTGKFVVLARGAFRPDSASDDVLARYLLAPHPFGESPDQETFPVLSSEIDRVVFSGYTDEQDVEFLDDLLDQMEHGRRSTTQATQFTGPLTAIEERAVLAAADQGSDSAGDPFSTLRSIMRTQQGADTR